MAEQTDHLIPRRDRDDRGSLVMAMLLVTVGMMLAGLLVPVVVTQAQAARYDQRRDLSIDAAQAGVDVMVGKIRDATDDQGGGTLTKLPCTTEPAGPVTGAVMPDGSERYQATIHYFGSDPKGHVDGSDSWIGDSTKEIKCATGGIQKTPAFAVIVSTGTASASGEFDEQPSRTVEATYTFQVLNANVLGGQIRLNNSVAGALCLDAGANPLAGGIPTLQPCVATNPSQLWAFNGSNQVVLANTPDTSTGDLGLCMYAPYNNNGNSTRDNGTTLTLQNCADPTDNSAGGKNLLRREQWGFQGFYPLDFIGTDSDGGQSDVTNANVGACWRPNSKSRNSSLVMYACTNDNSYSMIYDSQAGAGNASALVPNNAKRPTSYQNSLGFINNYGQFGRCLDDTYGDVPQNTYPYMIAYFCRSSPDPASYPSDAQLWTMPVIKSPAIYATGNIHLTFDVAPGGHAHNVNRSKYCLTSYPTLKSRPNLQPCNGPDNNPWTAGNKSSSQAWTLSGDTGDYGTSYRLTDGFGHCLQPDLTSVVPTNVLAGNVNMIDVDTCTSSTLQKWNSPPGASPSPIRDYHEK